MDSQVSRHTQHGLLLIFIVRLLVSTSSINDQQAVVQEHHKNITVIQRLEVGDLHIYIKNELKLYVQCIKI
jgi:hypothetical protein